MTDAERWFYTILSTYCVVMLIVGVKLWIKVFRGGPEGEPQ